MQTRHTEIGSRPDAMTWTYRAFHYLLTPLILRLWTRTRVHGREHLPATGPLIVITNHRDNWDTYLVAGCLRHRVLHFLARPSGLEARFLGWYWRRLHAIPADREGVAEALRLLRAGGAVGVFAEGVIAGELQRALPGGAVLALRSGAPVVPAAITGTERIRPWTFLTRPRVTVTFGPPRVLRRHGRDSQAVIDELMCEIAAMLPECNRGMYG